MRLDALKYFGILGMCLLHSSFLLDFVDGRAIYIIVTSIGGIVLPTYFFLSGYFFAVNYSTGKIRQKVISRFKKIVIPYLVWQIFFIYVTKILVWLNNRNYGYTFIDSTYAPSGIKEILQFVWLGYCDPPLWYLLVLFEFVMITPALLSVMKDNQKLAIAIIGVLFAINLWYFGKVPYASVFYWSPVYFAGLYMGVYHPKAVTAIEIKQVWKALALLLFLLFWCILCVWTIKDAYHANYFKYVGWMVSPAFVLGGSYLLPSRELYSGQFDSEFFIFCTHYQVIHVIACLLQNYINIDFLGGYGIWILTLLITFVILHLSHLVLKIYCPKVYAFLYGRY